MKRDQKKLKGWRPGPVDRRMLCKGHVATWRSVGSFREPRWTSSTVATRANRQRKGEPMVTASTVFLIPCDKDVFARDRW